MVPTAMAQIHGRQRVNICNFRVGKKNKELPWDFILSEKQVAKRHCVGGEGEGIDSTWGRRMGTENEAKYQIMFCRSMF